MSYLFNTDEFKIRDENIHIYILKLEQGKYYVGQAKGVSIRLKSHLKGKLSSDWTKLYKLISLFKEKETKFTNINEAMKLENLMTIWCMKKFGWQNVRGGDFCTLNENKLSFLLALKSDLSNEILPIKVSPKFILKRNVNYIFILLLEQNKYFIGHTSNILLAIINEYNSLGSNWTKKYKPLELITVFKVDIKSKIPRRELVNSFVIRGMKKYGFKNVRGGNFFNLDEKRHKNKVINYTNIFKKETK